MSKLSHGPFSPGACIGQGGTVLGLAQEPYELRDQHTGGSARSGESLVPVVEVEPNSPQIAPARAEAS